MSSSSKTKPPLLPVKATELAAALEAGFGTKKARQRMIKALFIRRGGSKAGGPSRASTGY